MSGKKIIDGLNEAIDHVRQAGRAGRPPEPALGSSPQHLEPVTSERVAQIDAMLRDEFSPKEEWETVENDTDREWIVRNLTRTPWRAEPHSTREDGGITICNDDENFALVPGYRNHPGNMITAHLIATAVNAYAEQQAELLRMHNEKIDNYERAIIAEAKGNVMKAALESARAEIIALGTPHAYASPIIQQIDAALASVDQTAEPVTPAPSSEDGARS